LSSGASILDVSTGRLKERSPATLFRDLTSPRTGLEAPRTSRCVSGLDSDGTRGNLLAIMGVDVLSRVALVGLGVAILVGTGGFAVVSLHERERRAAAVASVLAIAGALAFLGASLLPASMRIAAVTGCAMVGLAALILGVLPIGTSHPAQGRPTRRVDERDIMFARARLASGSPEHEAYYAMRPENREPDAKTRALPGLLSPTSVAAEPIAFASARASFALTEALRDAVDGPVAAERRSQTAAEWTTLVQRFAKTGGARDVGVTRLEPYHVYSHVGRGAGTWGEPIELDHQWAIALTVEMDHATMRTAPAAPVVAESARQYVESAKIALRLASFIRGLGYPARAHIDGNYRVIAPLVARDAGLGEIGRMGILMTKRFGPRVRIAVVTTDLPLVARPPGDDISVIDFCTVCKKCAENCPSGSIPAGDRQSIDGTRRW